MIRILRMAGLILCALAALAYGGATIYVSSSTDTKAPVISMDSDEITISTADDEKAIFSGMSAKDDKDGDVSETMVVEGMGNFVEEGVRKATVAAFDKSGNVSKASCTVRYSDYTPPRFYLNGPLQVKAGEVAKLSERIGATDCLDGDIKDNVQIISEKAIGSITAGTYEMKLRAVNSAGDVAELPVNVEVCEAAEYLADKPMLSAYLVYTERGEKIDAQKYLKGVVAGGAGYEWDSENPPEIGRDSISIEDRTDYQVPGVYEIVYTLNDAEGGNAGGSVSLLVVVEE